MKQKNTAIVVTLVISLILLAVDLILTLSTGELMQYLEANPIYPYVGITGIVAVNLIIFAVVYLLYTRTNSASARFMHVNALTTLIAVRLLVIINNAQVVMNPPTLVQAQAVTTAMKTAAVTQMAATSFIPFLIGIMSFIIWRMDHQIGILPKWGKKGE